MLPMRPFRVDHTPGRPKPRWEPGPENPSGAVAERHSAGRRDVNSARNRGRTCSYCIKFALARRSTPDEQLERISRPAVDRHHHGKGYGGLLLAEAMKRVLEVFETAGGIGLFVDAKDEAGWLIRMRSRGEWAAHMAILLLAPFRLLMRVYAPLPAR